jgi:type VI secretion system secreted protein VgrG
MIVFECGASKMIMKETGEVVILGSELHFEASGQVMVKGKVIDLN